MIQYLVIHLLAVRKAVQHERQTLKEFIFMDGIRENSSYFTTEIRTRVKT